MIVFILRKQQEEYHAKGKKAIYVFFMDLEKVFDREPKKVLWQCVVSNEKEKNARSFGYISDESV